MIYILNVTCIILLFSGIPNENLQYFTEQIRVFSANGDEVFVLDINARLKFFFMNAAYPSFIMSERFSPCKKLQNVNTYSLQFKKYLEILTNQRPYNSFKRAPLYFFSNNDISLFLSFCFDAFDWKNPGFFYTNCFSI